MLRQGATLSGGSASSTAVLAVGSYTVTATYIGDANNLTSSSTSWTQDIRYLFTGFQAPVSNTKTNVVNAPSLQSSFSGVDLPNMMTF